MKKSFITLGQFNAIRFALPQSKTNPTGITKQLLKRYNGTSYGVKLYKATDYDKNTKTTTVMYFIYAINYKDDKKSIVYQYEQEVKANMKFSSLIPDSAKTYVKSFTELRGIINDAINAQEYATDIRSLKIRGL